VRRRRRCRLVADLCADRPNHPTADQIAEEASPLPDAREALVELFDAIVRTVRVPG
jgi:hypothetical protein